MCSYIVYQTLFFSSLSCSYNLTTHLVPNLVGNPPHAYYYGYLNLMTMVLTNELTSDQPNEMLTCGKQSVFDDGHV